MSENIAKGLKVIELPYLPCYGHDVKQTHCKREIDDYRLCGVYSKADIPVSIAVATHNETDYPDGGSEAYGELNRNVCRETIEGLISGHSVLLVGGGCGHVVGLLGGIQQVFGKDKKVGFIWLDAHGDINTPTSTLTGLMGGMPLAVIAGLCCEDWRLASGLEVPIAHGDILLADGRNLDPWEKQFIATSDIVMLDTNAFNDPIKWGKAVSELAERVDFICLHIDLDLLDEKYVPGHYTPEPNGPEIDVVIQNIQKVMSTNKVIAYSVLSVYHEAGKPGAEICTLNGMRLIGAGLESWHSYPGLNKK